MRPKPWTSAGAVVSMTLALTLALSMGGRAQTRKPLAVDVPTLVGFKAPIRDKAGREVGLVTGSEAKPSLTSGQVRITNFRLETYRQDLERVSELVVESPRGDFGPEGASSDQQLTLRSVDGTFVITGRGWSWARAGGLLIISNDVRTLIRRPGADTNRPPVEVRSARFEYRLEKGDARFVGECVAEDPGRARVAAGELASRLSPRETRPQAIFATNGVIIELLRKEREGRAAGAAATYDMTPEGERIDVTGGSTWQFGPGEGASDELVLLPAQESYGARGHARLKLLPTRETPTPGAAPGAKKQGTPIEIECDSIQGKPEEVVFLGAVIARQTNRLELVSQRLVASLAIDPATRRQVLRRANATGEVRARLGAGAELVDLLGEEMDYLLGEDPTIEVRGNPTWRALDHQGFADLFVIHTETPSFHAIDNVRVSWRRPGSGTNTAPIELRAARAVVEGLQARFLGGVEAVSARWRMEAAELDLRLATNRVLREIDARRDVLLDYHMDFPGDGTNASPRSAVMSLIDSASEEALRWKISASELHAQLDPQSGELSALDLTGGVKVRNPALNAQGGPLIYRRADGLLRLVEHASLRTVDGGEIIGEPTTALVVDPRTAKTGIEGPVRKMVFPVRALRAKHPSHPTNQPPAL